MLHEANTKSSCCDISIITTRIVSYLLRYRDDSPLYYFSHFFTIPFCCLPPLLSFTLFSSLFSSPLHASGRLLDVLSGHEGPIACLDFSLETSTLASGAFFSIKIQRFKVLHFIFIDLLYPTPFMCRIAIRHISHISSCAVAHNIFLFCNFPFPIYAASIINL